MQHCNGICTFVIFFFQSKKTVGTKSQQPTETKQWIFVKKKLEAKLSGCAIKASLHGKVFVLPKCDVFVLSLKNNNENRNSCCSLMQIVVAKTNE